MDSEQVYFQGVLMKTQIPYFEIASKEQVERINSSAKRLKELESDSTSYSPLDSFFNWRSVQREKSKRGPKPKDKQPPPKQEQPSSTTISVNLNSRSQRTRKRKLESEMEYEGLKIVFKHNTESNTLTPEQLSFCKNIIQQLTEHEDSWPFTAPVDPVQLGIPDYFEVIKTPMDFRTILDHLNKSKYLYIKEFEEDVRIVFSNAILYNGPQHQISLMAQTLAEVFEKLFKDHDQLSSSDENKKQKKEKKKKKEKKAKKEKLQYLKENPIHTSASDETAPVDIMDTNSEPEAVTKQAKSVNNSVTTFQNKDKEIEQSNSEMEIKKSLDPNSGDEEGENDAGLASTIEALFDLNPENNPQHEEQKMKQ